MALVQLLRPMAKGVAMSTCCPPITQTALLSARFNGGHHVSLRSHESGTRHLKTSVQSPKTWRNSERRANVRCSLAGGTTSVGSFRAGQKRAEVRVPSLALFLETSQCAQGDQSAEADPGASGKGKELLSVLDAAVAGGVSLVVLEASEEDAGSASKLFEASCSVKALLRGRAPLLVWERADIAAAAGADGVLISDQGLPAVAARRMMESISLDSAVLPLVGREVKSVGKAVSASAGDGADLVILTVPQGTQLGAAVQPSTEAKESRESTEATAQATPPDASAASPPAEAVGSSSEGPAGAGAGAESAQRKSKAGFQDVDFLRESASEREVETSSPKDTSSGEGDNWVRAAVGTIRAAQVTVPLLLDLRRPKGSPQGVHDLPALKAAFEGALAAGASGVALRLSDVVDVLSRSDGPGPRATVEEILRFGDAEEAAEREEEQSQEPSKEAEAEAVLEAQEAEATPNGTAAAEPAVLQGAAEPEREAGEWEAGEAAAPVQQVPGTSTSQGGPSGSPTLTEQAPAAAAKAVAVPVPVPVPVAVPVPVQLPPRARPAVERRSSPRLSPMEMEAQDVQERERQLLLAFLRFLERASPQMAEADLLGDAVARLADPFLVVIVGEFNSGKSSLINALLGGKFLKVGAVPTTNEITLIKHEEDAEEPPLPAQGGEAKEPIRHPDGHILRYLSSNLLKQLNIVDTPGTNVILERQQRLTEEFVPQADIVLFVLSADRPLADSEVSFLRYIRQWGKKVVFVINKVDLLDEEGEGEATAVFNFVRDNVKRLLGVDAVTCFPVSSRLALASKMQTSDVEAAAKAWEASQFGELESFIFSFLGGSTGAGAERLRLKLDTPLGVGAALLSACERQLAEEREAVEADLLALQLMGPQMLQYGEAMRQDSELQQSRIATLVEEARERAEGIVDQVLRLDNVEVLGQYLLAPQVAPDSQLPVLKSFQAQVVGSSFYDVRRALVEHFEWLQSNNQRQLASYSEFAASRWPKLAQVVKDMQSEETAAASSLTSNGAASSLAGSAAGASESSSSSSSSEDAFSSGDEGEGEERPAALVAVQGSASYAELQTVKALEGFDTGAAALLLEEELRQAVSGLATGFGAAGVSASVLTSVFQNPLEDLLVLGLCTAGGSLGVLNLPSKREQVKKKVRRAAAGLVKQLKSKLNDELEDALARLDRSIEQELLPYKSAVESEFGRVSRLQTELEEYSKKIDKLRQRVRNIGS